MKLQKDVPLVLLISMMGCLKIGDKNKQVLDTNVNPTLSTKGMTSATSTQVMTYTPINNSITNTIPPTFTSPKPYTSTSPNTPIPTNTPTSTETVIPTDTPTFAWNPPGIVIASILLYHHVSDNGSGKWYYAQ